jgi:uncharacterized repeat protein (TIGR03803 family)
MFLQAASPALAFMLGLGTVFGTSSAQAQTYKETLLYSFGGGGNGNSPQADVISDAKGNLYGTTEAGGVGSCTRDGGCGTVFKVDTTDQETVLHRFTGGADGNAPYAPLIMDAKGNLYGTTVFGGGTGCSGDGCGTVFKVTKKGEEAVLYSFTGGADGANPYAGLIMDAKGNLYGNTNAGGGSGKGVVFELDPTTSEYTVLHSFTGGADGGQPFAGLISDAKGNLYGTATTGGSGAGVVFEVSSTGNYTVLHSFTGAKDGATPYGVLIFDAKGNLYGTNVAGAIGWGVVFKMTTKGKETVLHTFTGGDGGFPTGLVFDAKGNLYGTTQLGGPAHYLAAGVIYKLSSKRKYTILDYFSADSSGSQTGCYPAITGALILDAKGSPNGALSCGGPSGFGVVYKLTP